MPPLRAAFCASISSMVVTRLMPRVGAGRGGIFSASISSIVLIRAALREGRIALVRRGRLPVAGQAGHRVPARRRWRARAPVGMALPVTVGHRVPLDRPSGSWHTSQTISVSSMLRSCDQENFRVLRARWHAPGRTGTR